jgi:hypothetical protein
VSAAVEELEEELEDWQPRAERRKRTQVRDLRLKGEDLRGVVMEKSLRGRES